jgi:hypothetical protein
MIGDAGPGPSADASPSLDPPSPEEVRAQLARIIASSGFDASERSRGFLRFVVEETLAGRGERIKGYTIAVEVFGRDAAFDAHNDPVVRIEAGRLRRAVAGVGCRSRPSTRTPSVRTGVSRPPAA